MRFVRFVAKWGEDWTGRMNGIASLGLLIWGTFWPPSVDQGKTIVLAISAVCFVAGSYHVWSKEHQLVLNLSEKTQMEALDDLLSEFERLVNWYASDAKTKRKPLDRLIERARQELRHHAQDSVHEFNDVVKDAINAPRVESIPVIGRKMEDFDKWSKSDLERHACWQIASACHNKLHSIMIECEARLP
jgi:hypothetical protein